MPLRKGERTVEFTCEIRAVTAKALLVVIFQGKEKSLPMWIPKSQIAVNSEIGEDAEENDTGSLEISEWIAKQKELL